MKLLIGRLCRSTKSLQLAAIFALSWVRRFCLWTNLSAIWFSYRTAFEACNENLVCLLVRSLVRLLVRSLVRLRLRVGFRVGLSIGLWEGLLLGLKTGLLCYTRMRVSEINDVVSSSDICQLTHRKSSVVLCEICQVPMVQYICHRKHGQHQGLIFEDSKRYMDSITRLVPLQWLSQIQT